MSYYSEEEQERRDHEEYLNEEMIRMAYQEYDSYTSHASQYADNARRYTADALGYDEDPDTLPHWRIESTGDVVALLFFLAFMMGLFLLWFGRLLGTW